MSPSITGPSESRTQRLTRWLLTVVLASTLGAAPLAAPASAAPSDTYRPRCYNTLCLTIADGTTGEHDWYLNAWSLFDVGPTPYYISIFEVETGLLRAVCGSGTSCYGSLGSSAGGCNHFVAYIGGYPTSMPPAPVLRTSPVVTGPVYSGCVYNPRGPLVR